MLSISPRAPRANPKNEAGLAAGFGARRLALALAVLAIAWLALAGGARAVILPAQTIDGPSQSIVGFGGVAMAEDGTGGLVYLKRVDGMPHVFVSRYIDGAWQPPIRVDTGEPYAASWPRIGAADDGELIVVWVTPYATEGEVPVDELVGAELGPASDQFGPAIMIDSNVQDGTGVSPDLAVSSSGQADVVYRVVNRNNSAEIPLLRPGDVQGEIKVAHFDGNRWTNLGEINREPGLSMRPPSEANAPKIAIGPTGNGIVVWQEPEITGIARIWARRLFGTSLDYVLPVSASHFDGVPLTADADAPSLALSNLGQAIVAYRQSSGPGSPLPAPRIFTNILPDGEAQSGAEFLGAALADTEVAGGGAALVGPPSVDVDEQREIQLVYDADRTPKVIDGNDLGVLTSRLALGPSFTGSEDSAVSVENPEGGGISAWPSADPAGDPEVAVREDFPSGAIQTALVGGGAGGEVAELAVGRSGLGDGIVAFRQGQIGNAAIVATEVSVPPAAFHIQVPKGWIKPSQATISWEEAPSANGPVGYTVVLDGHTLPTPAGALSLKIDPRLLGDGVHAVQLLAIDRYGQATLTPPASLEIVGPPPAVHIAQVARGAGVSVRVSDAHEAVLRKDVRISFGDGTHAAGRTSFRHVYRRAGVYQVVAHVRSRRGYAATVRELVSIR